MTLTGEQDHNDGPITYKLKYSLKVCHAVAVPDAVLNPGDEGVLLADEATVKAELRKTCYKWNDLMHGMLGKTFNVLESDPEHTDATLVALPTPVGAKFFKWYFPRSVVSKVVRSDAFEGDKLGFDRSVH